jgi:Recombinase zinc beta ribbon domain
MGAARNGSALLAGLVVCARCGCRLNVHYDDGGAGLHTYECVERWTHYGEPRCQHLAGPCLDAFVSEQVLAALEPAALELSLSATERLEQERAELDRLWQQRRERIAYEVERAARQYQAVEPEHRLVARTLEHAWEEKLTAQQQLEEEYHRFIQHKPRLLSEAEREAIRHLAIDIPALWDAASTSAADRKEIIRQLVERVIVDVRGSSSEGVVIRPIGKLSAPPHLPTDLPTGPGVDRGRLGYHGDCPGALRRGLLPCPWRCLLWDADGQAATTTIRGESTTTA